MNTMTRFLLCVCVLTAAACEKEMDGASDLIAADAADNESEERTVVVTAWNDCFSRTAIGEKSGSAYSLYWSEGDRIAVNGKKSSYVEIDGEEVGVARFGLKGVTYPYRAVYPASAAGAYDAAAGTVSLILPSVQTYVEGGFDPAAAVMLGYAESGVVVFRHQMAYLKIVVDGGSKTAAIRSVRVRANNRESMSGAFSASFSPESCSISKVAASEDKKLDMSGVTLLCPEDGVPQGREMFVAIPAGTYETGINVFVVGMDDSWQEFVSSEVSYYTFRAEAGRVYSMTLPLDGTFSGDEEVKWQGPGIYTAKDWEAYALAGSYSGDVSGYSDPDGNVNLYADISTFTKFNRYTGGIDYTFDGHGHLVYQEEANVALFTRLKSGGVIKNLRLSGNMTVANSTYGTTQLVLTVDPGGKIENVSTSMAITGTSNLVNVHGLVKTNSGIVRKCTSLTEYKVSPTATSWSVAPIVFENFGQIDSCCNRGAVTVTSASEYNGTVSGICCNNLGTIENCVNTGSLTLALGKSVAGVAGITAYNGGIVRNCMNGAEGGSTGAITVGDCRAQGKALQTGGISCYAASRDGASYGTFENCRNYAPVTWIQTNGYQAASTSECAAIGGICAVAPSGGQNSVTLKSCRNYGSITVNQKASKPKADDSYLLAAGGILGYSGISVISGKYGIMDLMDGLGGYVRLLSCSNSGTIDVASANKQIVSMGAGSYTGTFSNNIGVNKVYVGGIAGFVYGERIRRAAVDSCEVDCIIKVGSSVGGNSASGGILGGGCYVDVNVPSVSVTYKATELLTDNAAALYRGFLAGVIGWTMKNSSVAGGSAVMTDDTGLAWKKSAAEGGSGYSGITGLKSPDGSGTAVGHSLTVSGGARFNGNAVAASDIYGNGTKTITD